MLINQEHCFLRIHTKALAFGAFLIFSLTAPLVAAGDDLTWSTSPDSVATSSPIADLPKAETAKGPVQLHPRPRLKPNELRPTGPAPADPALQNSHFSSSKITPKTGFSGIGFSGYLPPDPDMAVGPNHIVQVVNSQVAIFSKTGVMASGYPKSLSSLWSALGGGCATNNGGDPSIQFDRQANRWIITQLGSLSAPYSECIAVSTTGDPAGSYTLYAYSFGSDLNDYPKFSVWSTATPDYSGSAYLATYNLFANGQTGKGAALCVYDRQKMINQDPGAQQICTTLLNDYSYLPSDLDGGIAPPQESTGYTPAYFVTDNGSNALRIQKATWSFGATPALNLVASTLPVNSFSEACGGGTCVPQAGTTRTLDSLGDRPMYRLAYRNFGSTQSMVFNRSVTAGTSVGVRWYELKNSGSGFFVNQQSTFAPDSSYRWMGSMAIDKDGNIALGYSTSSSSLYPSLRATGRLSTDALNTLQSEQNLQVGGGSQTGYSRWGDYSSMRVDPVDDSTFWYTGEYYQASSSFTWSTFIGSFKLAPATTDFNLSATPLNVTFPEKSTVTLTSTSNITATPQGGFNSTINLTKGTCSNVFNWGISPTSISVANNYSAILTITSSALTVANNPETCTYTGTSGGLAHDVTVTAKTLPDFTVTIPNGTLQVKRGSSGSLIVNVPMVATPSNVSLSVSSLPSGTSASLNPTTVSTNASSYSTLTIKVNNGAKRTSSNGVPITVTGNNGNYTHKTSFQLVIN